MERFPVIEPNEGGLLDVGDVVHVVPAVQASMGGAAGTGHSPSWRIEDPRAAYLAPGRVLAATVVDLLWGDGAALEQAVDRTAVPMTQESYVAFQRSLATATVFDPAGVAPGTG